MKTFKTTIKKFMTIILTVVAILTFNSCEDSFEDEITPLDSSSSEQLISWNKQLNLLDLKSETAFVQNGESIQKAIDAALPGEIIYIEPGNFQEKFKNNKSDVEIIGLSITPNDLVIKNSIENNIEILKLYDQKSIDAFQKKRRNRVRRSISDFSRTELGAGIAHYQFKVRMGDGEFDIVRIHRIVRESRPYRPIPTKGDVFMVHGAFTGFNGTFFSVGLESSDINAKTSSPFYLASKNIDVWGIDMGWTMIPNDYSSDFSFMEEWGYEKDADHTLKAMRIARIVRGMTGQGFSAINLLGMSSGNTVAYAAANIETQKNNKRKRHVKGIISMDNAFKARDGDSGCGFAMFVEAEIASGIFQNEFGGFFKLLADLALGEPDGASPIPDFQGFTNIQAFRFANYGNVPNGFHFFGGNLEGSFYSDEMRILRGASNYSTFMPNLLWQEIDAVNCTTMDVSFDDYLHLISVPILYIGARGGSGSEAGFYTSSLTASSDITNQLVSVNDDISIDFGHVDMWVADNADKLVWSNLRNWLKNHQ